MKKLLLILFLIPFISLGQDCVEPKLPDWDKKQYPYIGDYVNSEIDCFISDYREYLRCQKELKKLDTLRLQTKLELPTLAELKKEVKWDSIDLKELSYEDVIKWGKDNILTGIQLQFGGFVSRPKDFADLSKKMN